MRTLATTETGLLIRHWQLTLIPVVLAAVGFSKPPAYADWATWQGNAAHTGYVPGTFDASQVSLRWRLPITRPGSIVVGGGTVFVWNKDSATYGINAFDQATGAALWAKNYPFTSTYSVGTPAYANGTVYFQRVGKGWNGDNYVYAFDGRTGSATFQVPYATQLAQRYLNPTPYGGNIYTGGGWYGGMYSFNGTTGQQNWWGSTPQEFGWTPAIDSKYAYAYTSTSGKDDLTIFDLGSGARITEITSSFQSMYSISSAIALGPNHDAFTANGGRLVCWDTTTDETHTPHIAWTVSRDFSGQVTLANGKVYVMTNGGGLASLDEATGAILWDWKPPTGSLGGNIIALDNVLLAATDTTTYAIDPATRSIVWSFPASTSLAFSDGTLYLTGADNNIYAFAVPEPATLSLLALGGLLLARRRRG